MRIISETATGTDQGVLVQVFRGDLHDPPISLDDVQLINDKFCALNSRLGGKLLKPDKYRDCYAFHAGVWAWYVLFASCCY